jgi:hypothetical protein
VERMIRRLNMLDERRIVCHKAPGTRLPLSLERGRATD